MAFFPSGFIYFSCLLSLLIQNSSAWTRSCNPICAGASCVRLAWPAGCHGKPVARPSSVTHSPSSAVRKGACKDGHTCCLFRPELITRTNKIGNWLLQEPVVLRTARGVPDGCTAWLRGFSIACPLGQRPSFPPACQVLPSRCSCSCRGDCPSASHPEVTALAQLLQLYPII